ncbi:MAG: hypothetical protein Kow0042_29890 [Calditrichia bacterium]
MRRIYLKGIGLFFLILISLLVLVACQEKKSGISENPPLPGFREAESDSQAIVIADQVMEKLGGRKNWDNTRYICWNFFGRRFHVWDKWTGNIRLEAKNLLVLMNIHSREGRAWQNGKEITHPDSLREKLQFGYEAWVNDSYWMFMPYKLKDSGVILKYLGADTLQDGQPADVLQLSFSGVGVTPHNKYHIYVSRKSRLVKQWAYFADAADDTPRFVLPWDNWKQYGKILLASDRGENRVITDIAVFDSLPSSVFEDPRPVDVMSFIP